MRLPYLKLFIDDSRRHGATLAALAIERLGADAGPLKSNARWWRGLLEDLWDYGVKVSGEARPDGVVKGKAAAAVLASCIGDYPGPALELVMLLEASGLLEGGREQLRVKGVEDLYGEAWDEQQERRTKASKAAKARWDSKPSDARSNAHASPEQPRRDAKTETEIKTEMKTEKAASSSRTPTAIAPPTTPPADWLAEDFWRWAESKRQLAGCPPQGPPHPAKLSGWWSAARSLAETDALQEAFLRFGDDTYWQQQKPALPFGGFISQWNDFLPVRRPNAP